MSKQRKYNDYKSVWSYKSDQAVQDQINILKIWGANTDKFAHREDLTCEDKIQILEGILKQQEALA